MKVTRLLVLAIALGAGMIAAILAVKMSARPEPAPVVAAVPTEPAPPQMETVDILVAAKDIQTGNRVIGGDLVWQSFPKSGVVEAYVTRLAHPKVDEEWIGMVARTPFLRGEPIREERLMRADRGFMSVILTPGMRAAAVEVKAASTAGGFVLPNDHVDIILTRPAGKAAAGAGDAFVSETILTNIRVLAVDQQVSDSKGEAAIVARDTVTLELSQKQAEQMAQSQRMGTISLVLRSLRESTSEVAEEPRSDDGGSVKMVRYGVTSTVSTRR